MDVSVDVNVRSVGVEVALPRAMASLEGAAIDSLKDPFKGAPIDPLKDLFKGAFAIGGFRV